MSDEVNAPKCKCGCGQNVKRHTKTMTKRGVKPGDWADYCLGHFSKTQKFKDIMKTIPPEETTHAGETNGNWRGGRKYKRGYVMVRIGGTYLYEHRMVAEQLLGRPLMPREVVHHINGVKDDNRPENLLVLPSSSEHARLHMTRDAASQRGAKGAAVRYGRPFASLSAVGVDWRAECGVKEEKK
jgi:hypothetical protein